MYLGYDGRTSMTFWHRYGSGKRRRRASIWYRKAGTTIFLVYKHAVIYQNRAGIGPMIAALDRFRTSTGTLLLKPEGCHNGNYIGSVGCHNYNL